MYYLFEKDTRKEALDAIKSGEIGDNCIVWVNCGSYPIFTTPETRGIEYVDLGLPSGTLWATKNIFAESTNDVGKAIYFGESPNLVGLNYRPGDYIAKKSLEKIKEIHEMNHSSDPNNLSLPMMWDAANGHYKGKWMTPTKEQWMELYDNTVHRINPGIPATFTSKINNKSITLPTNVDYWINTCKYIWGNGKDSAGNPKRPVVENKYAPYRFSFTQLQSAADGVISNYVCDDQNYKLQLNVRPVIMKDSYTTTYYSLPDEYQEVEWISSDGNSFINTGLTVGQGDILTYDVNVRYEVGTTRRLMGGNASSSSYFGVSANAYLQYFDVNVAGERINYKMTLDAANLKVRHVLNNDKIHEVSDTLNKITTNSIQLFSLLSQYKGNNQYLYSAKFTKNNVVVRDMIPCYRKSDNVTGMYDVVTKTFFTNATSGSFTVGQDVK